MSNTPQSQEPFRLGIAMAGAISAGAYTAGVMDYLLEALDRWQKAKDSGEAVPGHSVRIDAMTGASAGGMTAAIAARALQGEIVHVSMDRRSSPDAKRANMLYRSWVEPARASVLAGASYWLTSRQHSTNDCRPHAHLPHPPFHRHLPCRGCDHCWPTARQLHLRQQRQRQGTLSSSRPAPREQLLCESLLSWAQGGSHDIADELHTPVPKGFGAFL